MNRIRAGGVALGAVAFVLAGQIIGALPTMASSTCSATSLVESRAAVAAGSTLVSFSSLQSVNASVFGNIRLHDDAGVGLSPEICRIVPPTNDATTGTIIAPVYVIDADEKFTVSLSGEGVVTPEPMTITVVRSAETKAVKVDRVTPLLQSSLIVGHVKGGLTFSADPVAVTTISRTTESAKVSYRLIATESVSTSPRSVRVRTLDGTGRWIIRETKAGRTYWTIQMRSSTAQGTSGFHAHRVRSEAGDTLVVRYGDWAGKVGMPELWLDKGGNGTLDKRIGLVAGFR